MLAVGVFIGIVLAMLEVSSFWSMPSRRASTHPLWKSPSRSHESSGTLEHVFGTPSDSSTFARRRSLIMRVETETAHHPEVVTRVASGLALMAGDVARVEMLPTSMAELARPATTPARHATGAGDGAHKPHPVPAPERRHRTPPRPTGDLA